MESFSKRLETALKIRGMKQADLADKAGTSRAIITIYLQGKTVPRKRSLIKLAEVLDVNPAWLMGYDVPMNVQNRRDIIIAQIELLLRILPQEERRGFLVSQIQGELKG